MSRIVDLSLPIYDHMPVYPGDPEFVLEPVQTIPTVGWNMARLHMNTHDGTHVNVPVHGITGGNTLDAYTIGDFMGKAVVYTAPEAMKRDAGVIFPDMQITLDVVQFIVKIKPRFVGLAAEFVIIEEVEKTLLSHGIITYENLANTRNLSDKPFQFVGVPLRIRAGDGSPVRAYAVVE
ncbi:cyclase family protein [Patescibacteria group bacterium]|nr:cyclase family protein [Patescibacteria group bacterium]